MEGPVDELVQRILEACAADARERAARIITEATREAEEEVKALVKSAMKAALLRGAMVGFPRPTEAPQRPEVPHAAAEAETPARSRKEPETVHVSDARQGWYVYGITRSGDVPPDDLSGVIHAPIGLLSGDG